MNHEEVIARALKAWGTATVNRYVAPRSDLSKHVLAQARELAPGTAERAARQLVGRGGGERRAFMAAHYQVRGMRVVPPWAVDPVPCSNDADRPHDNPPAAIDMGIPDDLLWVERAVSQMARQCPLRALVVREEYTGTGSQRVKARRVADRYGGQLSLRQYRYELTKARVWLSAYVPVHAARRYAS